MSEYLSTSHSETPSENATATGSTKDRENRREKRGKHTLILRELAIIAALLLAILAFNLNWKESSDQNMSAHVRDEIKLLDVQVTKQPEPEKPEPKQEQPEPKPEPKVPKETPRREVPDEAMEDPPEPEAMPRPEPMEKVQTSPLPETSEPASSPRPQQKPAPKPPKNKIFDKGTVDRNPRMLDKLKPEYPRRAKRAGIQGRVIVQFVVDESGRPQNITVLQSPHDMLSEAAIEAVRELRFRPGQQNGKPVKVRMSQPVTFRLQ